METTKKWFWRNFTWKRFLLFTLCVFVFTFINGLFVNYLYPDDIATNVFATKELVQRLISSLLIGFPLAIWLEPKPVRKKID